MRDTPNDVQLYLIDEFVEDYQEGLLNPPPGAKANRGDFGQHARRHQRFSRLQ